MVKYPKSKYIFTSLVIFGGALSFAYFKYFSLKPQSIGINQVSTSNVYTRIPASLVEAFKPGSWTFTNSTTNVPSPQDWPLMDENQVFRNLLTHKQPGKNWTVKVGKGGQLYSISTPQTGELIPMQRGGDNLLGAEWMDEVFQHTVPYHPETPLPELPVGDIHQAGYYTRSDLDRSKKLIPHSVYSPTFGNLLSEFAQNDNNFSFITWPQHAHLPRTYKENLLVMQENLRDLGDGVIEVTVIFNKWGGITTTPSLISLPWTAVRTVNAPTQIISKPDGKYEMQSYDFTSSPNIKLRDNTTGGWAAFTKANDPNSPGIGFVFGKQLFTGVEKGSSYVRIGEYDQKKPTAGTVFTVKRAVELNSGDSFFYRYYIVLGTLKDIQKYGNLLQEKVQMGRIETRESDAQLVAICEHKVRGLYRNCPDDKPVFYTYRDFVRGSLPLFLLQNTTNNKFIVTSDPYAVDFDPTNGKTRYVDFLGWVIPKAQGNAAGSEQIDRKPISTFKNTNFSFATKEDQNLLVR